MEEHVSRREFLQAVAGVGGLAAASGAAAAQDGGSTTVAMTDDLVYEPSTVTVAPGSTVVWENVGNIGHTVTAYSDEIPENATYFASGGFDSEEAARSGYPGQGTIAGGETYEHTFETTGSFGYFCIPHESAGMVGTVEVTENPGGGGGGDGGISILPDSAKTLLVAATTALIAVLGFAWAFMKYGGDYGEEYRE